MKGWEGEEVRGEGQLTHILYIGFYLRNKTKNPLD